MPKLVIQNLKTKEEQEYSLPKDMILFGRINTCDIELPQKSVSRKHAEIIREGGDFFLTDLKSGNGTLLNNQKIRPLEKNLLRSGDTIKIEDYQIHFLLTEDSHELAIEEDTDTDIIEIKLIKKMLKALDTEETPNLEVLNGVAVGKKLLISEEKKEFIIGRDGASDLVIDEHVISRHHAKLEKKWGGVVVTDLDSKNGCFVNSERVREKLLRDGDKVMLGTVKLLYRNPKDVNMEIVQQEINRKKQEAALREAEALAQKQQEEEELAKEDREIEAAKKEAEAVEVEKALEKEPEKVAPPTQEPTPEVAGKEKFSLAEKLMIAAGIVVGFIAIVGLMILLF